MNWIQEPINSIKNDDLTIEKVDNEMTAMCVNIFGGVVVACLSGMVCHLCIIDL